MKTTYGFLSTFSLKLVLAFVFLALVSLGFTSVQAASQNQTICCEKTLSGYYCQDVPANLCDPNSRQVPTSCSSTSYCKPGTCFDQSQGTCLDNTPQLNCGPGGIWKATPGPECNLGCCVLGDQAAFVTLTRCKFLSGSLGLQTNYKKGITDEVSCITSVLGQEKGACVYEFEFQNTCKITTKAECDAGVNGTSTKGTFFAGKLCTADFTSLNITVNCGMQNKKICVPGKEEVYFVDTCGNPANIYDSTKVSDRTYWENILDKSKSCNPTSTNGNAGSTSCGNCNYLEGSICRTDSNGENAKCTDLNCYGTSDGKNHKHGEAWCVPADNTVGSRSYKHICINGKEVLEQCDDFRQQVCIQDSISYTGGTFSQAACRVNRWQDCTAQTTAASCGNTDARDCRWAADPYISAGGKCVPLYSPGLQFWGGGDASATCGLANQQCVVEIEQTGLKALIPKSSGGWDITKGDACVSDVSNDGKKITISSAWKNQMNLICTAVGDCGVKTNWVGNSGTLGLDSMFSSARVKTE